MISGLPPPSRALLAGCYGRVSGDLSPGRAADGAEGLSSPIAGQSLDLPIERAINANLNAGGPVRATNVLRPNPAPSACAAYQMTVLVML